jgi:hypothetical protein
MYNSISIQVESNSKGIAKVRFYKMEVADSYARLMNQGGEYMTTITHFILSVSKKLLYVPMEEVVLDRSS